MIHLELEFESTFCNSWPCIEILNNQTAIWQGYIERSQSLEFFFKDQTCCIEIKGIGKRQGEDNIWDTKVNSSNAIVADKTLTLRSVVINTVAMGQDWIDRLPELRYGVWYFNAQTKFTINTPVLNWIIQSKFVDQQHSRQIVYNNFNQKWNYSVLQDRIAELRERLEHA